MMFYTRKCKLFAIILLPQTELNIRPIFTATALTCHFRGLICTFLSGGVTQNFDIFVVTLAHVCSLSFYDGLYTLQLNGRGINIHYTKIVSQGD